MTTSANAGGEWNMDFVINVFHMPKYYSYVISRLQRRMCNKIKMSLYKKKLHF
jgi:hypothetical protein